MTMGPAARVTLCALLGYAEACCQQQTTSPAEYAWAGGAVFDRGTGSPLSKALVTLFTEEPEPRDALALTDANGSFAFANVPPGRYEIQASSTGHATAWYGAEGKNQAPGIITLHGGERRQNLVLRLEALGSVSGVVTDEDGDPLPRVAVTLLMQSYSRGKQVFLNRARAITDDRGAYRIYNVSAGRYAVMANGRDHQAFRMQPETSAGRQARFGVQFHPGTDRLSSAAILTVGAGKEVKGIDFRMPADFPATLRGRVVLPGELTGDSAPRVTIVPADLPDSNQAAFAFAVPPPHYSFEQYGMAPGEYLLVANLSLGDRRYRGVQHVSMAAGAEREIELQLEPGVNLSGSLRVEGDARESLRDYQVELSAGDSIPFDAKPPTARVNADGSFALKSVVAGIWDIGVKPIPPGGYIKSMRLGDEDVLTEDMIVGSHTAAPLRIVVSTRGGLLEGSVKSSAGEDARRAIVLLAPSGKFSRVLSFYSTALTGEGGRFKFKELTPGSYKLYAFEAMENGAWQDPEFLKPFESYGEKVEITEGVNPSKEVRLISGARDLP